MDIIDNMCFNEIFEQKLCEYTGFKNAVTVDCCTNGILISLDALRMSGKISKDNTLELPKQTYMSVPMTLKNNGWKITFKNIKWLGKYEIGKTGVYDAATDFKKDMSNEYLEGDIVCVSFQQKKRLSLGRGGVILFNNDSIKTLLKRLRHDGRDYYYCSYRDEIRMHPEDILCGYHCYMEPDKAAKGILIMNQLQLLPGYKMHSYEEYEDLTKLQIW